MKQSSETLTTLSTVNKAFIKSLPNSSKIFVQGSRDDILVPMRQIKLTDTIGDLAEKNEQVYVLDTSGPYTDPTKSINFRNGIESLRINWIEEYSDRNRWLFCTNSIYDFRNNCTAFPETGSR